MRLELTFISFLLMLPTVAGGQQPMFPPTVSPFADQTTWLLTRPFRYQILDTNLVIDVPAGFVTDFASIPRPLWTLVSPTGSTAERLSFTIFSTGISGARVIKLIASC